MRSAAFAWTILCILLASRAITPSATSALRSNWVQMHAFRREAASTDNYDRPHDKSFYMFVRFNI